MNRKNGLKRIVAAVMANVRRSNLADVEVPNVKWLARQGNAGVYGRRIVGSKKYRAYKRKANRRARNANGGKARA